MAFLSVSCTKEKTETSWEDRPGINVEGETLEEACDIALQRISECLYEIPQQDPALVYIVDWEKKCNEQTVLRWQWMPCDEIREEAGR